ncbi:uncharacterized protein LOC129102690 [Anoplopoma fimbria]|uniref:uncharacterized protein LOC129102690 n=1 Tax=Anoplopoma fimbria TaxID=229290 RepID=UPI0023EB68EF|nr:uncharacterized protein LOC129102690 [Anoplopoma fimbria]
MGQSLIGHTLPADAACGNAMIDMGPDRSLLILLKHCRDMKQQETRLRIITLLLLLGCTALFIFTICVDLRPHENSVSSGQGSAAERGPSHSKQVRVSPADSQTNFKRLRIHLRSVSEDNKTDPRLIRWDVDFGENNYDNKKRAIVIPEDGFYFVYVWVALGCHQVDRASNFKEFKVALHKWTEGYNCNVTLIEAWDGITCTPDGKRSVFVGQLFELWKGDHVSVWINRGYKLITKSTFGAYLA